jgi:hypothetical protein
VGVSAERPDWPDDVALNFDGSPHASEPRGRFWRPCRRHLRYRLAEPRDPHGHTVLPHIFKNCETTCPEPGNPHLPHIPGCIMARLGRVFTDPLEQAPEGLLRPGHLEPPIPGAGRVKRHQRRRPHKPGSLQRSGFPEEGEHTRQPGESGYSPVVAKQRSTP